MRGRPYSNLLLLTATVLLAACEPTLQVKSLTPARVNLGPATRLTLVQSEGGFSVDRSEMVDALWAQVRRDGYFQFSDHRFAGNSLRWAGSNRMAVTRTSEQLRDEVWLRIDVATMDAYVCEEEEQEVYDEETGESYIVATASLCGEVRLEVNAVGPNDEAYLFAQPYSGYSELRLDDEDDEAIAQALDAAIKSFLDDVTPRQTSAWVRLDDEDGRQEYILERAQDGDLAGAIAAMRDFLATEPESASAHYNLAVMLEASGAYSEALVAYNEALRRSDKDWYRSAARECARRYENHRLVTGDREW